MTYWSQHTCSSNLLFVTSTKSLYVYYLLKEDSMDQMQLYKECISSEMLDLLKTLNPNLSQ